MQQSNTQYRAVVISDGTAFYGDGTVKPVGPNARNLVAALNGTLRRFAPQCTVIMDDVTPAELETQSDAARAAGWRHSGISAWTLFHRADGRSVALGLRSAMNPKHLGILVGTNTDAGVQARYLHRYHELTGINWRGTCALTALAAIRKSWGDERYQPLWQHERVGPGWCMGPLVWSRELNRHEREWGWVHTYDANGAYLGAAGNADLAWSTIHHTGARDFDADVPGYWLVELNPEILAWDLAQDGRPPLFTPGRVKDGRVWLTTPYAKLIREIGGPLWVVDSWTARAETRDNGKRKHPAGSRVLRKFAETMRDAKRGVESLPDGPMRATLLEAVKRTYKDATGAMQRDGMRVSRADWAHMLIDLWRATLMRRIIRVHAVQGVWPVEIKTDSLSYADCIPRQSPNRHDEFENLATTLDIDTCSVGCGCAPKNGGALGKYKHLRVVTTRTWLDQRKRPEREAKKNATRPMAQHKRNSAPMGDRPGADSNGRRAVRARRTKLADKVT